MNGLPNIIKPEFSLVEALKVISKLVDLPLVLFVVDDDNRMVGTLTDGDVRRAIISGVSVNESVGKVMHRQFRFLRDGANDCVEAIRGFRQKHIKLIPVLDDEDRIVDVLNLDNCVSCLPVDAVLMAGGKGERLRPLTLEVPKPLLQVGGKAIIDHNIENLIHYGVRNISVTVNYLAGQIEQHFAEPLCGVKVNCVKETEFLGTAGSLTLVGEFKNDTVLLMNSDLFTNIDFEDFYLHFRRNDADMAVAAFPYSVAVPYGILETDGNEIKGLTEKPTYNMYANAGIYLIRRSLIKDIPRNMRFDATDLTMSLVQKGCKVVFYPLSGYWIDIGTHQEYQRAKDLAGNL